MTNLLPRLTLLALFALAAPLHAQTDGQAETSAEEAPAADGNEAAPGDLALGESVDGQPNVGETYISEVYEDWQMRCVRAEDGNDPCQLYQLLKDADGNSVAEISMFALPPGQQAAAGATIITPLETLLTQQVTLAVDNNPAKRYPFTFCTQIGCFARVGFTADDVARFKAGAAATMSIVPVGAPDERVQLKVSLKGFTAGYDAVSAVNAEKQE